MHMQDNYQKQLDGVIGSLDGKRRYKLLMHVCCAPCASYVLEYLIGCFDITVFFFDPNIHPESEYLKRLEELKKLLASMPRGDEVDLIAGRYEPDLFDMSVKGMEDQKEGGERCKACIKMRLEETAGAAAGKYDYFCTTLSVSPHKNARMINEAGRELSQKYGVAFLPSDFKKRNGYLRSIELCKLYGIYRQNYCGCRYSINNAGV